MSDTRVRHVAEYLYPGVFLPESTTREIALPTLEAVRALAPDDQEGYFRADGWYAAKVRAITEKRFESADGEEAWVRQDSTEVASWIVGERVHVDDPSIAGPDFDILRSNLRSNTEDGYGIRTRCGNWQMASDWGPVVAPEAVSA